MYAKRMLTRSPSSSNVNSTNEYIEYQDGSIAVMNHNETVEEINNRIKEEKRRKEEERLKKLRIETAKRRKRQEQIDAELKEKKENEIEKALQDRKKQIEASKLRKNSKTPECITTTNGGKSIRPTPAVADITKKQIRHLNILESLDLQGITSSTDMFLVAEKMSKRSSVRESEAAHAIKMIEITSARSPNPTKEIPLESPSNKTKRVRIQIVEEEKRKTSPRNNDLKLPQIKTRPTEAVAEKKIEKKKKLVAPHTGVSIDIEKIEKDIALIDKALLEKYQSLRNIDNNVLKRVNTSDRSDRKDSTPSPTQNNPKKISKPKRAKPVLSTRQRKF
ncbi:predicted protein [Naegleria gruberi]|uniref:Predicted protein n=1 Tax=Naegleria gruberi TaxID=5762 RepID=D2VH47_NAEGR|nr:uncharacterized protein NAEGRDRAFT_68274 [Naegleria gruberi]EFC43829.1 predicted protein [Naegleria gruberi]|eukprot:XP_002676573.1 predicted protein [Naegleria gruberi strain NEG-M]